MELIIDICRLSIPFGCAIMEFIIDKCRLSIPGAIMRKFIGREPELKMLTSFCQKKTSSFLVVKGRRRVGKSRLIQEFSKEFTHYYKFEGLAPDGGVTAQDQRIAVMKQFAKHFSLPQTVYDDWTDIFWAIGERVKKGRTLLFFDELSWMALDDDTFMSKLKQAWDEFFSKNHQLVFVICASASSWIEANVMSSSGFVGRISHTFTVDPLPIDVCRQFWPANISNYEVLKVLSVTGGIPKYLEEINPAKTAEENIKQLCFTRGGMLVNEFEQIFSDVFLRESHYYKNIVRTLAVGNKTLKEIQQALKLKTQGRLAEYLEELILAGFVKRDYTWDIKTTADSRLSHYRLSDNYLRFYVKYIEKNLGKIDRGTFSFKSLQSLPGYNSIIAIQFENLVLANRHLIHQALGMSPDEIISENPFFQRKSARSKGCQVDYLIQTRSRTLYVCEIKFSMGSIDTSVVEEVKEKIQVLIKPKSYSCRPVLIYVGELSTRLQESEYFIEMIDFERAFG